MLQIYFLLFFLIFNFFIFWTSFYLGDGLSLAALGTVLSCPFYFSILNKESKTPENTRFLTGCCFACIRGCSCQSVWKKWSERHRMAWRRELGRLGVWATAAGVWQSWEAQLGEPARKNSRKNSGSLAGRRERPEGHQDTRMREEEVSLVMFCHVAQHITAHMPCLSQPFHCGTSEHI